jgi:transposase-like protein
MSFLGLQQDDLIRGRRNIADFLGIHPHTLDNWRRRAIKNGDPMPIFCPGGCELESTRAQLTEWRQRQ